MRSARGPEIAKKHLIRVPMDGATIPHPIIQNFGAAKVMMSPAAPGTGVIAGGSVRPSSSWPASATS